MRLQICQWQPILSAGVAHFLFWFLKSELDEWSAEAGADYEDDNKEEDSSPPEDAAQGSPEDVSVSSSSEEEHVDAPPGDGSSSSEEVQNGNANEDEVKVGGGMPPMPTKMPSPEKMNDHETWCGNIFSHFSQFFFAFTRQMSVLLIKKKSTRAL